MNSRYYILIAEDDADDQLFITDALSRNNFPGLVNCVADGDKLLQVLKGKHPSALPSAILLDLNMPLKDGYQTLVELKQDEVLKSIPTVIFTSSSSRDEELRCLSLGASAFFRKPTSLDDYNNVAAKILVALGQVL